MKALIHSIVARLMQPCPVKPFEVRQREAAIYVAILIGVAAFFAAICIASLLRYSHA